MSNTNTDVKVKEIRCTDCNSLLAKASLEKGKIEIKCKCGKLNVVQEDLVLPEAESYSSRFDVTVTPISKP